MKKLLLIGLVLSVMVGNIFALDFTGMDNGLYKQYKAGDILSKKNKTDEMECSGDFLIAEGNKCYVVSNTEEFYGEKDFTLVIVTLKDRIIAAHLVKAKLKNSGSLDLNILGKMYDFNFKAIHIFNSIEAFEQDAKYLSLNNLLLTHNRIANEGIIKNENFIIETVFLNYKLEKNELINIFNNESPNFKEINRLIEFIEIYDYDTKIWTIRIDFFNNKISNLMQEDSIVVKKIEEL